MIDFYQTLMGRRFFEGTVPHLVRQLEALNEHLSTLSRTGVLDEIARQLDGKVASPDGWEAIAELVRSTGRRVRGP